MTNSMRKADRWYRRFWAWWGKDLLATYNGINDKYGWGPR